jgi:glycerol-3-phosphate dehydrogenase
VPTRPNLKGLAATTTDLLVIGGGVYGLCAAWEATRRGLTVALIERGDFGEATSSNSLHTMHGGLRYLQHLDIRRMRESIRERRFWLQAAPELISPMPFVLPTFGHGLRGPEALQAALVLNDMIAADRNRGVAAANHLPRGRRLSPGEAKRQLGSLQISGYNGAALWYDGFNRSPERLLVAIMQAAADAGASLVNYCVAEELLRENGRIVGAFARDLISGDVAPLRARFVLNTAGPWVDTVAEMAGRRAPAPLFRPSKAMNLVVRRLPLDAAIGMPAPRRGRETDALLDKGSVTYFILPWGEFSLIGTKHLHFRGNADALRVEPQDVAGFLAELNPILGRHGLSSRDVVAVKCGLLPEQAAGSGTGDVVLQKHGRVIDHEREDGIAGFMSIVGVKWTTARLVAQQAVHQVAIKLQCGKHASVIPMTRIRLNAHASMDQTALVPDSTATEAQFVQAARTEMAMHLADAVLRRTDLGMSQQLDRELLERAARAMGTVHGWSTAEIEAEVHSTQMALEQRQAWRAAVA